MEVEDDFIDLNFTKVEDLNKLEEKIHELQLKSDEIVQLAQVKSTVKHTGTFDQEGFDSAVDKIVSVVGSIQSESGVDKVDELIAEFGNVSVFEQLKVKLQSRQSILEDMAQLNQAQQVQDRITPDLSDDELGEIAKQIDQFNSDITALLYHKLNEEISVRRETTSSKLTKLLQQTNWLSKESDTISDETLSQIIPLFTQLINLQNITHAPTYPNTWYALSLLLDPIIVRFEYHFNTNKETNKLSKPEWALNYMETFLTNHLTLLCLIVDDAFKRVGRIGTYEIITCLLVPIRNKVVSMLHIINSNIVKYTQNKVLLEKNGVLLSHLIFELSSFDQRLVNTYKYNPYPEFKVKWTGVTSDVLLDSNEVAIENWLNFEQELASNRFNQIVNTEDAFAIDSDYQEHEHEVHILKPTYSAYSLVKLITNLTTHFKSLNIVKYQLKYISKIQMDFLERYHQILQKQYHTTLDKYNLKTRLQLIPGAIKDPLGETTRVDNIVIGLTQLNQVYCSCKFMVNSLEIWEDELIFIQLWKTYKNISSDLTTDSVFTGLITQYDSLVNSILNDYYEFFNQEIKELLKTYVNKTQWMINSTGPPNDLLTPLTTNLPRYLTIFRACVSSIDYFNITENIVTILTKIIYEYILTNNQFTTAGIKQLIVDFSYIVNETHVELLLNSDDEFSNDGNENYVKLVQAIDLLDSMCGREVPPVEQLRDGYEHKLEKLTDDEVTDLLERSHITTISPNKRTTLDHPLAKLFDTSNNHHITIPNKQVILLGRSSTCDVKLSGNDVSSKHCQMTLVRDYINVLDLSSNGLYVNDEILGKQKQVILKNGDKLAFAKTGGEYIFKYTAKRQSIFDDYIIGKQLGSGHYAVVKEATNKLTGEIVAVKIFHANKIGNSKQAEEQEKLQQEMNLLLSINHPNIVKFVSHYIEPLNQYSQNTYLVLEKMNSGELFQRIVTKGKLSPNETRAMFRQILSGLDYLHDKNIIHRDLKPENILLDITPKTHPGQISTGPWDTAEYDIKVKIADFGLAKFIGELKFTNTLCGTPAYVAPEILNNNRHYTTKVDLWSMGVLLYVCLCGFPPFSDELGPPNMKQQILTGKYAFYSPYWDDIDDIVLDLISNLLVVDAGSRFNVKETLNHFWFTEDVSESTETNTSAMSGETISQETSIKRMSI
ncbi:DNA damage response protein kinase DUN1 [Spathaspora sp. JA1]|nr:DNA damage response protein kinase DUN1 [Spathaspora sp. JA1]